MAALSDDTPRVGTNFSARRLKASLKGRRTTVTERYRPYLTPSGIRHVSVGCR
jgi:hypothetical protein